MDVDKVQELFGARAVPVVVIEILLDEVSYVGIGICLIFAVQNKIFRKDLWNWFANVEIGIGIVGGLSSLTLFLANLYLESYALVMYAEIW